MTTQTQQPGLAGFKRLLGNAGPMELTQGPRASVLSAGEVEAAMAAFLKSGEFSEARSGQLRCAALLWNDQQDEAHDLCQDDPTPEGAFLHAILHRREPDYWNSKYWFRRVELHPAFGHLASAITALLPESPAPLYSTQLLPGGIWDPFGFVDACELVAKEPARSPKRLWLEKVQVEEFEVLVAYILSRATR